MWSPRWKKVVNDLWSARSRTALVMCSIAVGVMAVGMILTAQQNLSAGMSAAYRAIAPASFVIETEQPFDDDLVQVVRGMRVVSAAEGRRNVNVRFEVAPDEWRQLTLFAISDFADMRVDRIDPAGGEWPPPDKTLLIERGSMEAGLGLDGRAIGDTMLIEPPNRKLREMTISGLAHDLSQPPAVMSDAAYGYIDLDTLEWLGEPRNFNELRVVAAGNPSTRAAVAESAQQVERKVEKSGRTITSVQINMPGESPVDETIQTVLMLMGIIGSFSLLLSAFLVVNTVSAVLLQHVRHIAIMKSFGGRTGQILAMYVVMVLAFGGGALLIGIPLSYLGARGIVSLVAGMLNYDVAGFVLSPSTLLIQATVGLAVPVLAALYPVISGVRITIREAISGYGLGMAYGQGIVDRVLARVRVLSRPLRLTLRNTFRRRGRLTLTLATLVIAGAAFVAIMSLRGSLLMGLDEMFGYFRYDVEIAFDRRYRVDKIEQEALCVPGVTHAESWLATAGVRIRDDASESNRLQTFAVPSATELMKPVVVEGRWLLPADENAIVVNNQVINEESDIHVGDDVVLDIEGIKHTWRVVGRIHTAFVGPRLYANYTYLTRLLNDSGRANRLQVIAVCHDTVYQAELRSALEDAFKLRGMRIAASETSGNLREFSEAGYGIMIAFLMVMALLMAVVGGLGLMGTMGINVMERTREIGVLRAIGASNGAVMQNVLVEGVLIGWLSWLLGMIAAVPLSALLADAVGMAFMQEPLRHTFSLTGAVLWLGIVTVIAGLASWLPARRAVRLTVREVLAYD